MTIIPIQVVSPVIRRAVLPESDVLIAARICTLNVQDNASRSRGNAGGDIGIDPAICRAGSYIGWSEPSYRHLFRPLPNPLRLLQGEFVGILQSIDLRSRCRRAPPNNGASPIENDVIFPFIVSAAFRQLLVFRM